MTSPPGARSLSPLQPSAGARPAGTLSRPAPVPQLARSAQILSSHWLFWSLFIALCLLGTFLRFWRLDFQAYWTDEAYTINRIRGTFAALLNELSDQGFEPGWYALLRLWRVFGESTLHMRPGDTYQPGYLRLLPAFFGALTVPTMYFLGRQFTDRRGALLVMLLAAVNPYFIYYSRELKMYACLWFFVALNMALFLHWQTTRKHLLWFPLFLLSAVIMTGLDDRGLAILALQLIFVLTRFRPKGWDAPLFVLAAGAAVILPYYWHYVVNNPALMAARMNTDVNKGMTWVPLYTDMNWRTIAGLPTAHILGYLWPVYPPDARIDKWFFLGGNDFIAHLATRSWSWMARGQFYAAYGLFAVLTLGLIPWRRIRFRPRPHLAPLQRLAAPDAPARGRWWWIFLWILIPTAALAATWIPTMEDLQEQRTPYEMAKARAEQDLAYQQGQLAALPEESPDRAPINAQIQKLQETIRTNDREIQFYNNLITTDWFNRIWMGRHQNQLWEPRYLGIVIPAWLIWLAACLRRFPSWPLRATLITATAGICFYSSLSNHLLYRNTPFNREAAILEQFIDQKDRLSAAVAVPEVKFPEPAEDTATTIARHVVPYSAEDLAYVPYPGMGRNGLWPQGLDQPGEYVNWIRSSVVNNNRIKLLVLTDRWGDMKEDSFPLSDDAVQKLLGPRWKLVYSDSYEWHYEWRFYIFHTWRTRVWKLQ